MLSSANRAAHGSPNACGASGPRMILRQPHLKALHDGATHTKPGRQPDVNKRWRIWQLKGRDRLRIALPRGERGSPSVMSRATATAIDPSLPNGTSLHTGSIPVVGVCVEKRVQRLPFDDRAVSVVATVEAARAESAPE